MSDPLTRMATRRIARAFETGRILPALLFTMLGVVFAFAAVMRIVDSESFPTFGSALWWSAQTVTTVGYGDQLPQETFGRLIAGLLMVLGFAFLSLVTGTIASALVSRHAASEEHEELLAAMRRLEERLDRIERDERR